MDNLRHADDTTLITKDEQEMSCLIERVERDRSTTEPSENETYVKRSHAQHGRNA